MEECKGEQVSILQNADPATKGFNEAVAMMAGTLSDMGQEVEKKIADLRKTPPIRRTRRVKGKILELHALARALFYVMEAFNENVQRKIEQRKDLVP